MIGFALDPVPMLLIMGVLFAASLFLLSFAGAIYVVYRALVVILTIDISFSRSPAISAALKGMQSAPVSPATSTAGPGVVEPYDEAHLALVEKLRKKDSTLNDEDLNRLIEQVEQEVSAGAHRTR